MSGRGRSSPPRTGPCRSSARPATRRATRPSRAGRCGSTETPCRTFSTPCPSTAGRAQASRPTARTPRPAAPRWAARAGRPGHGSGRSARRTRHESGTIMAAGWVSITRPGLLMPLAGPLHHASGSVRCAQVIVSQRTSTSPAASSNPPNPLGGTGKVPLGVHRRRRRRTVDPGGVEDLAPEALRLGRRIGPDRHRDPTGRPDDPSELTDRGQRIAHVIDHEVRHGRVEGPGGERQVGSAARRTSSADGTRPRANSTMLGSASTATTLAPRALANLATVPEPVPASSTRSARADVRGVQQRRGGMGAERGETAVVRRRAPGPARPLVFVERRRRHRHTLLKDLDVAPRYRTGCVRGGALAQPAGNGSGPHRCGGMAALSPAEIVVSASASGLGRTPPPTLARGGRHRTLCPVTRGWACGAPARICC